ncbi:MAG: PAS domain-containing protein, partial [Pseudomonadota bacterium]
MKTYKPPQADQGAVGEQIADTGRVESVLVALEHYPASLRAAVSTILNANHPMCVFWGTDVLCFFNDAFRHITQLPLNVDANGAPGSQVLAAMWPVLEPHIAEVMQDGKAGWHEDTLIQITRNDVVEDMYWTYSCSPVMESSAANRVGGVLLICSDSTVHMTAIRAAREEREQFAELFQQAPTFMTMLNGPEHHVELVSPGYQRLIGQQRNIVGRTIAEALPEVVDQGYVEILDEVYCSGVPFTAKSAKYVLHNASDGSATERYLDFVYQPIKNSNGKVKGIFVEGVDVTDHVLAEFRRNALIRFSDGLRNLKTPAEVTF